MRHITIEDGEDLFEQTARLDLKPAASTMAVCLALLTLNHAEGRQKVKITVHKDLVPVSYHQVPAMFARAMASRCPYSTVQAFLKGEYMVVYAGEERTPSSFRERVRLGLTDKRRYSIERKRVPLTYRRRPSLMSSIMTSELGKQVCNACKNDRIIWRIRKAKVDK